MSAIENRLNEDCNLIIAGTHEVYIRPENGEVFVADKELQYPFSTLNAMTQAQDTAKEAYISQDGCAGCPIKGECKPEPVALKKTGENILIPALTTSFKG